MEGDFHTPPPMYTASEMADSRAAERASVRRKLLEAIAEWRRSADPGERNEKTMGADAAVCAFVEAINRICPEEG